MSLSPGVHLGPYEILAHIGAGGMGEIYRARDTRLDRTVAIKVLAASLTADPQLRARFDREARAISSLNHPHICALFDVGHQDGVDFIVLEYLEGQTLAQRLAGGGSTGPAALDPADALKIAIDLSDALDQAHRAGIVHRDLKPANVMLTKAGAKLLDFGLAKSASPAVAANALSMLPTTPPNLTVQGTILGTFQYMAPEQIEGLEADARTDIFAFGALLYEMLTGRTAFEGKTRASLLGAILKDEPPPVSRASPAVPAALDRIIGTCLAKDPDDRYQSARDLRRDLTWVASGSSDAAVAAAVPAPVRSSRAGWLAAAVSTIALIAVAVVALRRAGEGTPAGNPIQFTIAPPEKASFGGPNAGGTGTVTQVAVSPDGRHVAFVAGAQATYQIWLRPLAATAAMPIPGTEGGAFPFWSPDSRSIGFFAAGKLKRVSIAGGPPIPLCDAPGGRGGSWNRDNVILFAPSIRGMGLMRVPSAGGVPTVVTTLDPTAGEDQHRWPHFLPDGRHFFYTAITGACCPAAKPSTIRIASLDPADAAITLLQSETSVTYASGHLVYAREDTLMAQPFDPDARRFTGDAFPLAEHVGPEGSRYVSASVSENGTLVYARDDSMARRQLTWFDRAGRPVGTVGDASPYIDFALSADERRVAVTLDTGNPANRDIWIIDVASNLRSRLTVDPGTDGSPVWSPNGLHIAFEGERSGTVSLRRRASDGTGADESLLDSPGTASRPCDRDAASRGFTVRQCTIAPSDWSSDGRFIAYTLGGSFPLAFDVWALPLFGDRKPFPVVQTAFLEASARFSPDGRWIAYSSTESGQPNIYVQPFPAGAKHRVSRDGGSRPHWRADGRELFYLGADGAMNAVQIDVAGEFSSGEPQALFPTGARANNFFRQLYAVTRDGKRFLVNAPPPQSSGTQLTVVVDWTATLQK